MEKSFTQKHALSIDRTPAKRKIVVFGVELAYATEEYWGNNNVTKEEPKKPKKEEILNPPFYSSKYDVGTSSASIMEQELSPSLTLNQTSVVELKPKSFTNLMGKFYEMKNHSYEKEAPDAGETKSKIQSKDPWIIKKKLTTSDLGNLSRLILPTKVVEHHLLPQLEDNTRKMIIDKNKGWLVDVYDHDLEVGFNMVLKKWPSCGSYVFNRNWVRSFVIRRKLEEGDVIGMYWDTLHRRFVFSVLERYGNHLIEV